MYTYVCKFDVHILFHFFCLQYLKLARELSGYGDIVFPHCACDSRKEGHVVPAVGAPAFKLHAAKEDGTLESQVVEFQWNTITRWEVDEEGMAFCFQYTRQDNRPPRWLKLFTPYVSNRFVSLFYSFLFFFFLICSKNWISKTVTVN